MRLYLCWLLPFSQTAQPYSHETEMDAKPKPIEKTLMGESDATGVCEKLWLDLGTDSNVGTLVHTTQYRLIPPL